jgi:hypothetical protein
MSLLVGMHAWFTSWLQKSTVLCALKDNARRGEVRETRIASFAESLPVLSTCSERRMADLLLLLTL